MDLVTSYTSPGGDPTGAENTSGTLNYTYLNTASNNTSPISNGLEDIPVSPSGPSLVYFRKLVVEV